MRKFREGGSASFGRHHHHIQGRGRGLLRCLVLFVLVVAGGLLMLRSYHHSVQGDMPATGEPTTTAVPQSPDGATSAVDKARAYREAMEAAVRSKHIVEGDQRPVADGGDDLHQQRESTIHRVIDKLRSGGANIDDRDFAALEQRRRDLHVDPLRIDDNIARSIEEHKKKFKELLEQNRHVSLLKDAAERIDFARIGRGGGSGAEAERQQRRLELERRVMDDLRNTAFGAVGEGVAPRKGESEGHQQSVPSLSLAIFTTFKSCEEPTIRYAQLDAVTSWVSLPIYPAPVVLLFGGDSECSQWAADIINKEHSEVLGNPDGGAPVVRVISDAKTGESGHTILLGSAVARLRREVPNADVYGLINADILLDPLGSVALHRIAGHYKEYFVVGHRHSVTIPLERRESYHRHPWAPKEGDGQRGEHHGAAAASHSGLLDFYLPGWSYDGDAVFAQAKADRVDAEDFFFWSRDFFQGAEAPPHDQSPHLVPPPQQSLVVPEFHIGRPAYDNWLVHHAIHTWKPTIDASEMLLAFHQAHDYRHLENVPRHNADGNTNNNNGLETKPASYWGGVEQRENYDLGLNNGGWQHGSMDMLPLGFEPSGCADVIRHHAIEQTRLQRRNALLAAGHHGDNAHNDPNQKQQQHVVTPREALGKMLFDWFAFTVTEERANAHKGHSSRSGRECSIKLRSGWRPFAEGAPPQLATEVDYLKQYDAYHATA